MNNNNLHSGNDAARKKYLAKIQKLMRLAKNTSSPQEAANALSKAQAFMREHGLSESEVTFSEISTSSSKGAPSDAVKIPKYMGHLGAVIEKAFGVKCIYSWRTTPSRAYKRVVNFYGHDGRDIVAAYVFDVLTRQLKNARENFKKEHCYRHSAAKATALADKFCEGWAAGAYHAVQEMVLREEQAEQLKSYSEQLASQGVKEAKVRSAKDTKGSNQAGHLGYCEGKNAKVYHGVDGSQSAAQISLMVGGA